MIKAQIIADSVCSRKPHTAIDYRITTWILTYPRFIHAEFMTHRVFSRNAASSRAIPVAKMLKMVADNPAMPEYWGANQSGMQAAAELDDTQKYIARENWLEGRNNALQLAQRLVDCNTHKQIANRVIEPWNHITVLATATEHLNFFALRAHKDAQPEFQVLAYTMLREYLRSAPKVCEEGEWHIPFGDKMPEGAPLKERLKIATARAARVSYVSFDGDITPEKDYELHDRLMESGHWSPFEHCAEALPYRGQDSNFKGWKQYRKCFENEDGTNKFTERDLVRRLIDTPRWVQDAIDRNNQKS